MIIITIIIIIIISISLIIGSVKRKALSRNNNQGISNNKEIINNNKDNKKNSNDNNNDNSISNYIKEHFNAKMKNNNIPLFKDFESYSRSLPVRLYEISDSDVEFIPLNTLNYYVCPEDLTSMAAKIIERSDYRGYVKYISAPPKSGKTSSVLPAFLKSIEMKNGGTHYIYVAFNNNNRRSFKSCPFIPSSDPITAEDQGAAFIVQCIKTLLERPDDLDAYKIKIEESPKGNSRETLIAYLKEKFGNDYRIWFHLDEHGDMCDRSVDATCNGAPFSRGALSLLASIGRTRVIATYTEKPTVFAKKSSKVCRFPIPLPAIDINQILRKVSELSLDKLIITNEDEFRMLASLKFRLVLKMTEMDIISILHRRGTSVIAEEFLKEFEKIVKKSKNTIDALTKCNALCGDGRTDQFLDVEDVEVDAARLLLGTPDIDNPNRQFSDVVSLKDNKFTVSVKKLMSITDPNINVYETGRDLFKKRLRGPDLISSTPLEACYYWTLACRSALNRKIELLAANENCAELVYKNCCKQLLPGRLFPGDNSSNYDFSFLQHNTIYYADEYNNGKPSHPLANLFFISDNNELVLVGITGGNKDKVKVKKKRLTDWIKKEQKNIPLYKLKGVVLAPNIKTKSKQLGEVAVVCGEDAIKLLGGLSQIARWLE